MKWINFTKQTLPQILAFIGLSVLILMAALYYLGYIGNGDFYLIGLIILISVLSGWRTYTSLKDSEVFLK